jgi:integrase
MSSRPRRVHGASTTSTARPRRVPSYRLHKASGQAVVTLSGVDHYLGKHGTPASEERYNRLLAEWLAANRTLPAPQEPGVFSVADLVLAYWSHAKVYYADLDGKPTSQTDRVHRSLQMAQDLYGPTLAREFGPLALKAVRLKMVEQGWCRKVVNQRVGCLVRAFKWAVGEQLLPAEVWQALQAVPGLRKGKTVAPERAEVKPVEPDHVLAIREHVLPAVWAMVQVQDFAAMRPGEVVRLAAHELERTGDVWLFRPGRHKKDHLDQTRTIFLGPRAQAVLLPWLERANQEGREGYLFSARDAVAARYAQLGRTLNLKAKKIPGEHYQVTSYARSIAKGCARAGIPRWHPHQLRHGAATRLAAEFGVETARVILGHSSLDTTKIYAEQDLQRALDIMRQRG